MKVYALCLCCILGAQSFGFELSKSEHFEQKLEPTDMEISFTFQTKATTAQEIRERLHPLIVAMKKRDMCSGGAYTINPEYNYEKNKSRQLLGFSGRLGYVCHFEDTDLLDEMVSFFDEQEELDLTQSPIRWVVKEKKIQEARDLLELQAVQHPKNYIQKLKDHKIAKCKIEKISLNTHGYVPVLKSSARIMSSSIPEPTKQTQEIQISAEYLYKCKEL